MNNDIDIKKLTKLLCNVAIQLDLDIYHVVNDMLISIFPNMNKEFFDMEEKIYNELWKIKETIPFKINRPENFK